LSSKIQEVRVPTGIPGLDPLIQGGLQRGDFVLLLGGLGTGKTIFSCEFVYNAALAMNEPAVFATFEEDVRSLKRNMMNFGFDLSSLEANRKLKLVDLDVLEGRGLSSNIQVLLEAIDEIKAKRLVVDSLTAFLSGTGEKFDYTFMMHLIYKTLKREGITTLMTASRQPSKSFRQETGVEEFVADGIFQLESYVTETMDVRTRFVIKKLRGTDHDRKYHSLAFTPNGISILAFSG
jgi:circadian clock protein KaiC